MSMNILTDPLGTSVTVCGESVPIETDYRRWLLVMEVIGDGEITNPLTRIECLIMIACPTVWKRIIAGEIFSDEFVSELIDAIVRFASCGEAADAGEQEGERVFDFTQDGEMIYASFMQAYGIDLCDVTMHWHKFMALLRHLPAECEFMRVVQLRQCDTSKIEDDSLRRRMRRAKAAVRVKSKNYKTEVNKNG